MIAMKSEAACTVEPRRDGAKNLTVGSYRRVLLTFAFPMFLSMLFQQLYITVAMRLCHDIFLLYLAFPITWGISAILYFFYYRGDNWAQRFDPAGNAGA